MLTDQGFRLLLDRLEKQAIDLSVARGSEQLARKEGATLRTERDRWRTDAENADRQVDRQQRELEKLKAAPSPFPFLVDNKHTVFVAFEDRSLNVGTVADDAGEYQSAGDQPDYAALIAAPLLPRCYLTCRKLDLVRLPEAPTGRLRLADDIPF